MPEFESPISADFNNIPIVDAMIDLFMDPGTFEDLFKREDVYPTAMLVPHFDSPYFTALNSLPPLSIFTSQEFQFTYSQRQAKQKTYAGTIVDDWGEGSIGISAREIKLVLLPILLPPDHKIAKKIFISLFEALEIGTQVYDSEKTLAYNFMTQLIKFYKSNCTIFDEHNVPLYEGFFEFFYNYNPDKRTQSWNDRYKGKLTDVSFEMSSDASPFIINCDLGFTAWHHKMLLDTPIFGPKETEFSPENKKQDLMDYYAGIASKAYRMTDVELKRQKEVSTTGIGGFR